MFGAAIVALLPIYFVLALDYAAGRAMQINADQSLGAESAGGTGGRGQHRDHLQ